MARLRMMSVRFSSEVTMAELPKFRGAVIAAAGVENDLFHNHQHEGFAYRYPLVQYRIMGGKASLVALNEGIEQMQQLLGGDFLMRPVTFGNRCEQVRVEEMRINEFELSLLETPIRYHISHWLPFNQDNYRLWQRLSSVEERVSMLNKVLVGNLISFAKGIGWQLEGRVEAGVDYSTITERFVRFKGQHLVALQADFTTNLFLPRGIALGKGVALNKGIVTSARP